MDLHRGVPTASKLIGARRGVAGSTEPKKAIKKVKDLERLLRSGLFDDEHGGHSGFRIEERQGFETILRTSGLVDVFRELYPKHGRAWIQNLAQALRAAKETVSNSEIEVAMQEGDAGLGFTYWDQQKVGARRKQ